MNIEQQMSKLMQQITNGELCMDCKEREPYEGEYCEECQFERDVCQAEMWADAARGH